MAFGDNESHMHWTPVAEKSLNVIHTINEFISTYDWFYSLLGDHAIVGLFNMIVGI